MIARLLFRLRLALLELRYCNAARREFEGRLEQDRPKP